MRLAFAVGLLVLGFAAATPARADFAVITLTAAIAVSGRIPRSVRRTGGICLSGHLGVGFTASPLGKWQTRPCIGRSTSIVAITGGESQPLPRLLSVKPWSPQTGAFP